MENENDSIEEQMMNHIASEIKELIDKELMKMILGDTDTMYKNPFSEK